MDETLKSTIYLGSPVWFVNWTENLFSAAATSSNHTFYSVRQFLNVLRTVFKYGLRCMVSQGGSMDQSLTTFKIDVCRCRIYVADNVDHAKF